MTPFRHGLEVIDRFSGLHLDHAVQPATARRVDQHKVWEAGPVSRPGRDRLLAANVDPDFVSTTPAGLELSDDPVVLQLFTNGA